MCNPCYQAWYTKERRQRGSIDKDRSAYLPSYGKPPRRPKRNADCHPDRPHVALGLCRACYQKDRPDRPRAECHPDRPLVANGKCGMCLSRGKYWSDPEKYREQANRNHQVLRDRDRAEMVTAYGGKCACVRCPETNPAFLTLDHIGGGGKAHRAEVGSHSYADLRRRGWPQEGYRLLCWNCNAMTRYGPCPHEGVTDGV